MNDPDKELSLLRDLNDLASIKPDAEATARAMQARGWNFCRCKSTAFFKEKHDVATIRWRCCRGGSGDGFCHSGLRPTGTVGGLAFGEIQSQVAKTRSVQYTQTHKSHEKTIALCRSKSAKSRSSASTREREHVKITTAGAPCPTGSADDRARANM